MVFADIVTLLKVYKEAFNEVEIIINELNLISDTHNKYSDQLISKVFYSRDTATSVLTTNYVNEMSSVMEKFNLLTNMKIIGKFEQRVEEITKGTPTYSDNGLDFIFKDIIQNLNICLTNYLQYERKNTQNEMSFLIQSIHDLKASYNSFNTVLNFSLKTYKILEKDIPKNENNTSLDIRIRNELDVNSIAEIIISTNKMYEYLCGMLDVSANEYPLLPAKIESGSLFEKVFGNTNVINVMEQFLKGIAMYFYRNYTKEGKFNNIPSQLNVIKEELHILELLKENGYKAQRAEDELDIQLTIIFQHASTILSNTTKIEINNEEYSASTADQKFLEYKNNLMLEQSKVNELTNVNTDEQNNHVDDK